MVRIRLAILLFAGWCVLCGCQREASIPSDNFRLTVPEVVSESDVSVSLLTIRLSRRASISVDGDGFHSHVVLPDAQDGVVRKGEMAVSAARVAPSQDKFAYVQHAMSNARVFRPQREGLPAFGASSRGSERRPRRDPVETCRRKVIHTKTE